MKKLILTITLACMSVMATQAQTKGDWYVGTGDISNVAWTQWSVSPTIGYGITENLILGAGINQTTGEVLNVDVNVRYLVRGYFAYLESNLSLDTDDIRLGAGKMFTLRNNVYVDPKIVYSTGDQTTNLEIGFGFRF
jgi:hypothetical protein|tara:strand:- start:290 stop:700 length:411 start_codon:yes stop_codon:yes gene_type:complete